MSATQSVTAIPEKIEESLSALRNPAEATAATHQAAVATLEKYEAALGISADPSASFGARLEAVKQAAEKEVTTALLKPLSEAETAALSLEAIRQAQENARQAFEKLTQLSAIVNDEAFSTLLDNRKGFGPHRAYLFSVEPSKGTVLDELKTLLGEAEALELAEDWRGRCDLNQKLEATQVALFLESNNKAKYREYAEWDAKTTQEEDFTATKYQFADDLAATLLCARIFEKRWDGGALSEGEQDLYQKLKDGHLRSCSGSLHIYASGRYGYGPRYLCVCVGDGLDSNSWALGKPLSRSRSSR